MLTCQVVLKRELTKDKAKEAKGATHSSMMLPQESFIQLNLTPVPMFLVPPDLPHVYQICHSLLLLIFVKLLLLY